MKNSSLETHRAITSASFDDWRDLARDFLKLHDEEPRLRAEWYGIDKVWLVRGNHRDGDGDKEFKNLATRAAMYAGHPAADGWKWWLDRLVEDGSKAIGVTTSEFWSADEPLSKELTDHHSWPELTTKETDFEIKRLCKLSETYCKKKANQAYKEQPTHRADGEDQTEPMRLTKAQDEQYSNWRSLAVVDTQVAAEILTKSLRTIQRAAKDSKDPLYSPVRGSIAVRSIKKKLGES